MSKHTAAPWAWHKRADGEVFLATPDRGLLLVMDFTRKGMTKGQPRFAVWDGEDRARLGGRMVNADALDVEKHPDARLIAAAPELLKALKTSAAGFEALAKVPDIDRRFSLQLSGLLAIAREAIAKAEIE